MRFQSRVASIAAIIALATTTGCANGGLGNILGSVLGGGQNQSNQVDGAIIGVNTRSQQIAVQTTNGQRVSLAYDSQTQVVYQNRNYPVTALENGDQVTARLQSTSNGGYYTDYVQVNQSSSNSTNGSNGTNSQLQSFQGTVRQVDTRNGLFSFDTGNGNVVTVSLPYRPSNTDLAKFQSLRNGEYVRFAGVVLNDSRVELRQFY